MHDTVHVSLSSSPAQGITKQKHLGMILDGKLNFQEYFKAVLVNIGQYLLCENFNKN